MPNTIWVDSLHNITVASGGKSELTLMFELLTARSDRLTLLRTILCHDYSYTVHDAGEGTQTVDVGIGVTSDEAFNAGVLPDPETASEHPTRGWVYRCRHRLHGFAADQAAVDVRTVNRDLRSKRVIQNGELFLSITNQNDTGAAASIQVTGITRCLFLIS